MHHIRLVLKRQSVNISSSSEMIGMSAFTENSNFLMCPSCRFRHVHAMTGSIG